VPFAAKYAVNEGANRRMIPRYNLQMLIALVTIEGGMFDLKDMTIKKFAPASAGALVGAVGVGMEV